MFQNILEAMYAHSIQNIEYKHMYSAQSPTLRDRYLYPLAYNGLILRSIWRFLSVNLF